MKIANGTLKLRPTWDIPVVNVTPAEAQFLVAEHQKHAKGAPLTIDEASVRDIERSDRDELGRLLGKYKRVRVLAMYPKASFRFPDDYKTALEVGLDVDLPADRFVSEEEVKAVVKGDE
jgi:hypothetical protein